MIYFENTSMGGEGFNTHVMRYTMCVSLSNFLDRDFFFNSEKPSSTPPDYAANGDQKDKFRILLESPRSHVSDLVELSNRRVFEIDRDTEKKVTFTVLSSYFLTTEELRARFEGTFIWNSFAVGRLPLIREELLENDLIEFGHLTLASPGYAYFLGRSEKMALLDSVRIRYLAEIESLSERIRLQVGSFNAVHIRLGDFRTAHTSDEYSIDPDIYRNYIRATFTDKSLPILVATDALHEKDDLSKLFPGFDLIFIDELVFDEFGRGFTELPFTDFNVLTVIDQLLCSAAERFIGTYRSTFTTVIHRLRQERYGKKDFYFFPDTRVAKLINADQRLVPDRTGFFDWNRYSIFSETHDAMSWGREWDRDLTTFDV